MLLLVVFEHLIEVELNNYKLFTAMSIVKALFVGNIQNG